MRNEKIKYQLNSNLSFDQIVYFYLFADIMEIGLLLSGSQNYAALLFPACLYLLYLKLKKKSIKLTQEWYLFTPFIIMTLLTLILVVFKMIPENWSIITDYVFIVYAGIIILLIFFSLPSSFEVVNKKKFFLLQYLNLLMAMIVGFVFVQAHFGFILAPAAFISDPKKWIFLMLLIASVSLKIQYFFTSDKSQFKAESQFYSTKTLERFTEKIRELFENQRIFLRQDLDLSLLSRKAKMSREDLNYFFTQYLEKDIRLFIAEYRVAYAIELFEKKGEQYTIEAIANECGFKSRNTFNRYFTQITGTTPSAFLMKKKAI